MSLHILLPVVLAAQLIGLMSLAIAVRTNRSRFAEMERQLSFIDGSLMSLRDRGDASIQSDPVRGFPVRVHLTFTVSDAVSSSGYDTETFRDLGGDLSSQNECDPRRDRWGAYSRGAYSSSRKAD